METLYTLTSLPAKMDALTLTERAAAISKTAASLASELSQTGHPEPTFEHGLPVPLHGDAPDSKAQNLKKQLLHMADELRALVTEPYLHLTPQEVLSIAFWYLLYCLTLYLRSSLTASTLYTN